MSSSSSSPGLRALMSFRTERQRSEESLRPHSNKWFRWRKSQFSSACLLTHLPADFTFSWKVPGIPHSAGAPFGMTWQGGAPVILSLQLVRRVRRRARQPSLAACSTLHRMANSIMKCPCYVAAPDESGWVPFLSAKAPLMGHSFVARRLHRRAGDAGEMHLVW